MNAIDSGKTHKQVVFFSFKTNLSKLSLQLKLNKYGNNIAYLKLISVCKIHI